jgi:hypothetical protein
MKQVQLLIKKDGGAVLYIDGVNHGTYASTEVELVKGVLKTLNVREADMSTLRIDEE